MNLNFDFVPAQGLSSASGKMRQSNEDFVVHEVLSFEPCGTGDHIYLYIEKNGSNTDWVATQLARIAGLKSVDIGYAGLKDRHAVTRQWFSLHFPGKDDPDWSELPENLRIITRIRHQKKLRADAIEYNEFQITLRDIKDEAKEIENRLQRLKQQGFPNYFGSQRFGREQNNVGKLLEMVNKRKRVKTHLRGLYISSGRSYLFNHILKARILEHNWNKPVNGDVMNLDGSRGIFVPENYDEVIETRVQQMDIHPAAVLWGSGESRTSAHANALESACISANQEIAKALEVAGARLAYRAMRVRADNLEWQRQDNNLLLKFILPSGAYATSLIHEILNIEDVADSQGERE